MSSEPFDDTEEYDLEILKQLDFARFTPDLILYEHNHSCAEYRRAASELLSISGYEAIAHADDTLAVR